MARMLPEVDATEIEHESESVVYEVLRDGLPDSFTVVHSYPWLRPWRGRDALLEGEADFVVLNPRLGLLVLEVKGGKTIGHSGKDWFRETASGREYFQNPFTQARRNMHALLEIVEERSGNRILRGQFVYGYAVVFPHMDYEGEPPPDADKALIISRRHLSFIDQVIETAYGAWTEKKLLMSPDRYHMLLNDCLLPKFKIFRPIGPDIDIASKALLELTELQATVFEGLYSQNRVLVEGVAGSGKTILATHRALSFARCGKKTLFVCFNKDLAAWIRREIEEDPSTADFRQLLTVRHFHALASELAQQAGIPFEPADGGPFDQRFWDDEVPDLIEQAMLALSSTADDHHYQALVVDEAQDFPLGWWYSLTESLLDQSDAPIYAFIDPNQSLRGEIEWPPVKFEAKFRLNLNCRNTRKVANASASILGIDAKSFEKAPEGVLPRIIRSGSQHQQKGLVLEELRRLIRREYVLPRQIAIIGPASKKNGSLADVSDVDGISLVTSAEEWRDGGGVLVTTARSFKGLEADVVILYDLGRLGSLFRKEDLYVACTRARVLLVVIVHGPEVRSLIEECVNQPVVA